MLKTFLKWAKQRKYIKENPLAEAKFERPRLEPRGGTPWLRDLIIDNWIAPKPECPSSTRRHTDDLRRIACNRPSSGSQRSCSRDQNVSPMTDPRHRTKRGLP